MPVLERFAHWDLQLCLRVNRVCRRVSWRMLFRCVSVLGDGLFWYALMAALLVAGRDAAVTPVLHMMAVGLACTFGYKWLKARTLLDGGSGASASTRSSRCRAKVASSRPPENSCKACAR